jgi:hypothetical protein
LSSLDCPWAVPVLVMSRERGSGIMQLSISQYSTMVYGIFFSWDVGRCGSARALGYRFSSLVALESPDPAAGCRCFGL